MESDKLDVNISSIVSGALSFIVLIAWVEVIRSSCDYAFSDDKSKEWKEYQKNLRNAFILTILAFFTVVLLYKWAISKHAK